MHVPGSQFMSDVPPSGGGLPPPPMNNQYGTLSSNVPTNPPEHNFGQPMQPPSFQSHQPFNQPSQQFNPVMMNPAQHLGPQQSMDPMIPHSQMSSQPATFMTPRKKFIKN